MTMQCAAVLALSLVAMRCEPAMQQSAVPMRNTNDIKESNARRSIYSG